MVKITFIGTGNGMPIASTSSCIFLEDGSSNILLDCGGGHDVLEKFYSAKIDIKKIKNIFITHYDSDHILGIVPIVRAFSKDNEKRKIFCSQEVLNAINSLFTFTAKKHFEIVKKNTEFIIIKDKEECRIGNWKILFFDIKSNKSPQFGCRINFDNKKSLAFPGDEPIREHYKDLIRDVDVLIHEAFCLENEKEIFQPHEKNHGTVMEAAKLAAEINAKNLILFHMEDKTLKTRKKKYTQEAKKNFNGNVFVPVDLDVYQFENI